MKPDYDKSNCSDDNLYTNECNKFLLKKEIVERNCLSETPDDTPYLYPNLNDKLFNVKIAEKKEFNDTKYDGTVHEDIKEYADALAKADFELSPHQAFVKNFLSFQTPYNSLLLYHGLGSGKCHAINTPIIMYDGTIKMVQDIQVNDLLMGDDSRPRRVLSLAQGLDKMYNIIPVKGESYVVNQEHILCLKASGFPKISHNNHKNNTSYNVQWIENNKFQSKTFTFNPLNDEQKMIIKNNAEIFFKEIQNNRNTSENIIEIPVKDYILLSNKKKSLLKGYKVSVEFSETPLPIDPYIIGYWLGDGSSRGSVITSQDATVLHYFKHKLKEYDLGLFFRSKYDYGISGNGKIKNNVFLNALNELNLVHNKHIPHIYKCNSRENRLKLLAGLLDSDGSLDKKSVFEFSQKNEKLMDDVVFLSRSLGFACYKSIKKTSWTYNGVKKYGTTFRINISGEGIETIPTKIERKQAKPRQQIKDVLVTGIDVKYVNEDNYYGFTLDDNCRYLMGDFTVTHNTCSAIGVCEEMRDYLRQIGLSKRTIIVASENVQDNFRLQLFDERKLKLVDGLWNIRSCTGNKLLKEINPMNMKGIPREKVISQIKTLINNSYLFLGYGQFANYIIKIIKFNEEERVKQREERTKILNDAKSTKATKGKSSKPKKTDEKIILDKAAIRRLRNEFNDRLLVIDEVHNIRKTGDNENKKVAMYLEVLIKIAINMRLLLLSATPMYNSYKEIIWLLNLMNINDRRAKIDVKDVFDKDGNFKGKEGEEMLIRKATGYVSFVRGENPYTFPYRVYPDVFAIKNTFPAIKYPTHQMNTLKINEKDRKRILNLYLLKFKKCNNCGECQNCAYKYIINYLRNKNFNVTTKKGLVRDMPTFTEMESFGYTLLLIPLESLIISYPYDGLKDLLEDIPSVTYSDKMAESVSDGPSKNSSIDSSIPSELLEEGQEEKENEEEQEHDEEKGDVENDNETFVNNDEEQIDMDNNDFASQRTNRTLTEGQLSSSSNKTKTSKPFTNRTLTEGHAEEYYRKMNKKTKPNEKEELENYSDHTLVTNNKKGGQGSSSESNYSSSASSSSRSASMYIHPDELTGQKGLRRIMNYVDEKSPPEKGSFEYTRSTLTKYGKIFSRDNIGKYSLKINEILENIYSIDKERVSEGIILIYSQYIDSGLIPVALALEEMGFVRYGQGAKSLFKNKPTETIDVRTMKPPEDRRNYMPACYSMITGDPRLSPNNDFEVKALTNDNNKEGHRVKIVLISKAGSEGIDFKFIRQIHVLEPWYNMNRIDQIIGRGVRNFSHKDLPFEKRNTQIFLYGTILEDNKEEAADLYVYRVAEYKAIQIGKVSRVLKETAVDCIINNDQTNFTQKNMSKKIQGTITQELSTGFIDNNFQIGDAPYSSACDYMEKCEYDCRPNKEIDEDNLNEDTYNEKFIMVNSEKILQKIKLLMKQSFFYKKDVLIELIRTPKPYPYVQIYAALTLLIEDNNEFIVDKYGRTGHLINVGEYYLFQPSELRNKNISIFERSVPIDFKHKMVNFELNQQILKPVVDKRNIERVLQEEKDGVEEEEELPGKQIFDELKANYDLANEFTQVDPTTRQYKKVPRADDNWYKHSGVVIRKMATDYPTSKRYLLEMLTEHLIETLLFEDKLELINYLYSLENIERNSFEWNTKNYFDKNTIKTKSMIAIIFYKINKRQIMILDKDSNKWIEADSEDEEDLAKSKEAKEILKNRESEYNETVGFIGYKKGNKGLVFKTKDMLAKRNTGARCDESGKDKTMTKLNKILGEEIYTKESTRAYKDADGNLHDAISQTELCVLQEFLLRFFNKIKKDGKIWFVTPEMALYFKF